MFKITLLPQSPEVRKSGAHRLNVIMPVMIRYGGRKNEWLLGTVAVPFTDKDKAEDFAERTYEEALG